MTIGNDIRLAARQLAKDPGFTLAAACALALGIAANTTVFTIVNAMLLRDLPFDAPDRIVALDTQNTGDARAPVAGVSHPEWQDWQAGARAVDGIGAFTDAAMNVAEESLAPERFRGMYISANSFGLIRQRPAFGRDFRLEDDRPGAEPVVLLGHSVWTSRYAGDAAVIGRVIRINGIASTVIGVMPEGFAFPRRAELWQPLAVLPERVREDRAARRLQAFGRMKPGVTIEQVRDDLGAVAAGLSGQHPDTNTNVVPRVRPFRELVIGGAQVKTLASALMAAVVFVLLIACANVANLLLARGVRRAREISVRMSIGATRWRVTRQLLVESLLLAVLAGAVALALAAPAVRMFRTAFASDAPYGIDVTMDASVFVFFAAVTLGTTILFGLVPALHTARANLAGVLNEAGRGSSAGIGARRWTAGLVVVQLALTIVLLTGAASSMRDALAQYQEDVGIDTAGVVVMRLSLPAPEYPDADRRATFYRRLEERLAPSLRMRATFASAWPRGGAVTPEISIEGRPDDIPSRRPTASQVAIGLGYFEALGTRPVRGRDFTAADTAGTAIVNERFAAMHFPDDDPIGRRIRLGATPDGAGSEWLTIVGVVPNVRQRQRRLDDRGFDPVVYIPYASFPLPFAMILARSGSGPGAVAGLMREHVRALDADLPLWDVMSLDAKLAQDRVEGRELSTMFGIFAGIALVLATVGLYAVTACSVSQRTREIGVRIALGAQARHVWWVVTRRASAQLGAGLAAGLAGALGLGQVLQGLLTVVRGTDPLTLTAVVTLLIAVTAGACVVPARRAMRLDPAAALRSE
jgi:putative ABC transport system permease protein